MADPSTTPAEESIVDKTENTTAANFDQIRESVPDGPLRTCYDIQVGSAKGIYSFGKGLTEGIVGLLKFAYRLNTFDPEAWKTVYNGGLGIAKRGYVLQFGTPEQKLELAKEGIQFGKALFESIKKSVTEEWEQAGATGKRAELISKWSTRGVLEVASLFVGAGEVKAGATVGKAGDVAADLAKGENALDKAHVVCDGVEATKQATQAAKAVEDARAAKDAGAAEKVVEVEKGGTSSALAPGGGLDAHEAAGGHLLDMHVGLTYEELASRLAKEPRIDAASSFTNRVVAEKAVAETIDTNKNKIADWLASGRKDRLPISHTMSEPVGISVPRGVPVGVPASSVKVILIRDAAFPAGYRILTGYPEL